MQQLALALAAFAAPHTTPQEDVELLLGEAASGGPSLLQVCGGGSLSAACCAASVLVFANMCRALPPTHLQQSPGLTALVQPSPLLPAPAGPAFPPRTLGGAGRGGQCAGAGAAAPPMAHRPHRLPGPPLHRPHFPAGGKRCPLLLLGLWCQGVACAVVCGWHQSAKYSAFLLCCEPPFWQVI